MFLYPSRTMPRPTRCKSVTLHSARRYTQKQNRPRAVKLHYGCAGFVPGLVPQHGTKPTHPKKSLQNNFCATVFYFFVLLPSLHFAIPYLHPVEQTKGDSGKNNNDTAHPPFGRGDSMPYHYYFYSSFISFFHEK